MGFLYAISWEADQKWLLALFGFHVFAYFITIYFRKSSNFQMILLVFWSVLVYLSEFFNAVCAVNWKRFSSQNYFDEHGVFTGIFWAAPLIILLLFQLFNALYLTSYLLVDVKVAEFKQQKKKKDN
mmetsp:Transcript_1925/g.2744  ORF Transcript_1925/g.2744 Transcript_1925/m.2744 type:complete len:126 (+) Transcript_1925:443-820(+)